MSALREGKRIWTVCILALLIFGAGCGKSPDELYESGRQQLENEETIDAGIVMLEKFLKKHPDDPRSPEVGLAVASAYQNLKNFEKAIAAYSELIERHPSSNEACKALFLLGYMYYDDMNDLDNARSTLKKFIETYPDSELTVSAKVLIENLDVPVDEWPIVKELEMQSGGAAE